MAKKWFHGTLLGVLIPNCMAWEAAWYALFGGGGDAGFGGTGTPFCADEAHAAARNTHGRRTRAKGGEALLLGQL